MLDFWYPAVSIIVFLVSFPFLYIYFRNDGDMNPQLFGGMAALVVGFMWPFTLSALAVVFLFSLMGYIVEMFIKD